MRLPFEMWTYNGSQEPDEKTVYILMKGQNAGKPGRKPWANSMALICTSAKDAEQVYTAATALHHAKVFEYYLKGSVIPFITVRDMKLVYSIYIHLFTAPPAKEHQQLGSFLAYAANLDNQRHTLKRLITGFARQLVETARF